MPSAGSRPRLYCPAPLAPGQRLALPAAAARHVQVLRLQPGEAVTLFNGAGGEFEAVLQRMGRSDVEVLVGAHSAVEREPPRAVHLAVGMPANERMDWLVEKATELGAASIQPLVTQHGVLRLAGERAQKKRQHWEGVAAAACEQCGRNRVPAIHEVQPFADWIARVETQAARLLLSPADGAATWSVPAGEEICVLSGPEGGLSRAEEQAAVRHGFLPVSLGPRVLRAETAPLAALALLTLPG